MIILDVVSLGGCIIAWLAYRECEKWYHDLSDDHSILRAEHNKLLKEYRELRQAYINKIVSQATIDPKYKEYVKREGNPKGDAPEGVR